MKNEKIMSGHHRKSTICAGITAMSRMAQTLSTTFYRKFSFILSIFIVFKKIPLDDFEKILYNVFSSCKPAFLDALHSLQSFGLQHFDTEGETVSFAARLVKAR